MTQIIRTYIVNLIDICAIISTSSLMMFDKNKTIIENTSKDVIFFFNSNLICQYKHNHFCQNKCSS